MRFLAVPDRVTTYTHDSEVSGNSRAISRRADVTTQIKTERTDTQGFRSRHIFAKPETWLTCKGRRVRTSVEPQHFTQPDAMKPYGFFVEEGADLHLSFGTTNVSGVLAHLRRKSGQRPPLVLVVGSLAATISLWIIIAAIAERPVWLW